jgi:hypothetical protein
MYPERTPVLVSAGEYFTDPGIGLGGAGGISGLEVMSALRLGANEFVFEGFVEGEVGEDGSMAIEEEEQTLPERIDNHDRFYVNF